MDKCYSCFQDIEEDPHLKEVDVGDGMVLEMPFCSNCF